jgi:hypothetical protein
MTWDALPVVGADLRAALVASCLRGALPPVDLRAVCFVLAIKKYVKEEKEKKEKTKNRELRFYYEKVRWGAR